MEINSTYTQQTVTPTQPVSAQAGTTGAQSEQKAPAAAEREAGTDNTVNLSAESLKLAKSTATQETKSQPAITDRQQAQQLLGQLIAGVREQPDQAQAAFGLISGTQAGSLLA